MTKMEPKEITDEELLRDYQVCGNCLFYRHVITRNLSFPDRHVISQ